MDFDYDVPAQFRRAGVSLDDRVLAWKFLGGYHFNEYFGAELAYVDARKLPIKVLGVTLGNLDRRSSISLPRAVALSGAPRSRTPGRIIPS